jgi:hypothetical protein
MCTHRHALTAPAPLRSVPSPVPGRRHPRRHCRGHQHRPRARGRPGPCPSLPRVHGTPGSPCSCLCLCLCVCVLLPTLCLRGGARQFVLREDGGVVDGPRAELSGRGTRATTAVAFNPSMPTRLLHGSALATQAPHGGTVSHCPMHTHRLDKAKKEESSLHVWDWPTRAVVRACAALPRPAPCPPLTPTPTCFCADGWPDEHGRAGTQWHRRNNGGGLGLGHVGGGVHVTQPHGVRSLICAREGVGGGWGRRTSQ